MVFLSSHSFGQAPDLGSASEFAVFTSVGAFTNDGATVVIGDIGSNVGGVTGFPPGVVIGSIHDADGVSATAASDVCAAYSELDGILGGTVIGTTLGSGQTLTPDIYILGAASTLNGELFLDAGNDPNAIFIFQIDGAFSTTVGSMVTLINGASFCNIYWQINGAVTLGEGSFFQGTIVANGAIHILEAAALNGRALTCAGAIDLHNNKITNGLPIASTISASGATTFCTGDIVTLSGNVGGTWSTGETTESIVVTVSGDYFVTNTGECGSVESNHISVTVNPLPVCEITGDNVLCEGGSTSFTATGGTSYSWTGPNGFTASTATISDLTLAGTYTVTVTDGNGCESICSRKLTVNKELVCYIKGDNVICEGGSTSFTAKGGTAYSWTGPGGFTASTATISNLTLAGIYTVTVSADGCESVCSRELTINPLPVCEITGNNVLCEGGSTSFTATGGTSYSWTGPGGFTASMATISDLTLAGIYTVTVTDGNGCESTCSRELTVSKKLVCYIKGDNVICEGESASFTATGGTAYSWTGPGGFTASTATISNLTLAGIYTVTVSANGCESARSRELIVNPFPVCEITGNNVLCEGGSTSFTATGGTAYSWIGPGGFTASTATISDLTLAGIYTVTVTDGNGCESTCSRELTVSKKLVCYIKGDNVICEGGSTSFTATGGTAYSWTGPGGFTASTATISNLTLAGIYTVTVSADGCESVRSRELIVSSLPVCEITGNNVLCEGGSTSFTATGGTSYSWTGPGSFTASTATISDLTLAGIYTVTVTDGNGCESTCSRELIVSKKLVCYIKGDNVICEGGSTSFTATGGTAYSWTGPGGFTASTATISNLTLAGIYTVTVSADGCESVRSRGLTVNPLPVCNITGDNVICEGESASFTATGGTAYSWTGPGGFTASTATIRNLTLAGIYTVTVRADGCESVCSRELTAVSVQKGGDFIVSPNPFVDKVNVSYSYNYDTDVFIEIRDIRGILIDSYKNTSYKKGKKVKVKFDLTKAVKHMLFVKITTNRGVEIKKVISSDAKH
ncbi:ice-binding family protein [Gelidibacter sp.]|uniref:ice-binding family protein n=1 Tax=Gelidibacter sp. TaxID=2018083 RepID=UPI003267DA95